MRSLEWTAREMTVPRPLDATTAPPHTVAGQPAKPSRTTSTARRAAETPTPTATTSTSSSARSSMTSARPEASSPSAAASAAASASGARPSENYFKFTDKHEQFLVKHARRHASALVVDALYDTSKWKFIGELKPTSALSERAVSRDDYIPSYGARKFLTPAQHALEVFELRASAIDRVACVAPRLASDPQQLAQRSHTLLARTRVRGKLDEFMQWMTTRRRAVYQGMMNTLHEGSLQHCDVFSGFDAESQLDEPELEQFALKYFIVEPSVPGSSSSSVPTATTPTATPTTTSSKVLSKGSVSLSLAKRKLGNLLRRGSTDSADPTLLQQEQRTSATATAASSTSSAAAEGRMHFCVGEYSTVRPGMARADTDANVTDKRIGIISYHSVEDPELLQLCNSIAKKTTPREVRRSSSRTLMQFSGIVAYPVASEGDQDYLEVVIKVSCFDARGLSSQKRSAMLGFISGFRNLARTMLVMRLRASPFLTTAHWVADERRKCCLVCQQRFSSLRRRHHCRLCGEVTCAKCSAVHQVRIVKENKASLRICVLCVQGVDRPKWRELTRIQHEDHVPRHAEASVDYAPFYQERNSRDSVDLDTFGNTQEEEAVEETAPKHLLDFSFVAELAKSRSPKPIRTPLSSLDEGLQLSEGLTVSMSSSESEGNNLDTTIRDFHDSAFHLPAKSTIPSFGKCAKGRGLLSEDLMSLQESSATSDEEEEEFDRQAQLDMPRSASPVTESVQSIRLYEEPEVYPDYEPAGNVIRRISGLGEDDQEEPEDEDDARLQALAPYGLLETDYLVDGVMPEDIVLQSIVQEAAQQLNCAIAAIGFVDASRDMVSAAYSASPLCQVPRGVLPKQHSLTWDVMQRCHNGKKNGTVILDTTKDKTLHKNPFVIDSPCVRFMVGIPLRAWNGVVIGALMVADIQPRAKVSAEELLNLTSHASLVEKWLENKRDEIATTRTSARGSNRGVSLDANRAVELHDRLAEMLFTSHQTNIEVQMRGMQMKQQVSTTLPQPAKAARPVLHKLF